MFRHTFLLRALAVIAAIALAVLAFPAHGAKAEREISRACAAARSGNASSAASSSSSSSATRQPAPRAGSMTSSVTAGPGGLTGTTTMPDGSTVTVNPGRAGSPAATAVTEDCIEEGVRKPANGKRTQRNKENRR